jgi:anti-anti-sigma regulatory factor
MAADAMHIDRQIVGLPTVADAAVAAALQATLLAAAHDGHSVLLDASEVDELGAAVVQVIEVARRSFAAQGRLLAIRAPSDAFTSAYQDLGLFSSLMEGLADLD